MDFSFTEIENMLKYFVEMLYKVLDGIKSFDLKATMHGYDSVYGND